MKLSATKISVVLPILAPTPFLRAMTEFSIKTLRMHATQDFELVVVEAGGRHFDPKGWSPEVSSSTVEKISQYLCFEQKIGVVKELNAAVKAAAGDFIVFTGNDVFVPPKWDEHLLRCFEERQDCGIASLSAMESGFVIGPREIQDRIVEGMYSPFCMFKRGWVFDEAYVKIYQDSDMVMRMYDAGLRAYRSCRAHVHHLGRMTTDSVEPQQHNRDLARDERLFYQRWGKSPLMMFGIIRAGRWMYGHEHESFDAPITLHYDPNKAEG